ncbi:PLC-like phosphodiesterase [Syncephalis fuscata]|nr:PLC-like phosphodiesterase [Syncephalis fuscata]
MPMKHRWNNVPLFTMYRCLVAILYSLISASMNTRRLGLSNFTYLYKFTQHFLNNDINMQSFSLFVLAATVLSLTSLVEPANVPMICNGSADYCDLPFNRYTFPGTHNSAAYDLHVGCPMTGKCEGMSKSFASCFWENQPRYFLREQLNDGIRLFDIDTCVASNNEVLTCHGEKGTRALGTTLDEHLQHVKQFLYGDYDGNEKTTIQGIMAKLNQYLPGKLFERLNANEPWPTLGEMIKSNKQVVVFFGKALSGIEMSQRPRWALNRTEYFEGSWGYTRRTKNVDELVNAYREHAKTTAPDVKLWQCIDYGYDFNVIQALIDLFTKGKPYICLESLARNANTRLKEVADIYDDIFHSIHRIKIDYYFNDYDMFMNVINDLNQRNVKRYAKS